MPVFYIAGCALTYVLRQLLASEITVKILRAKTKIITPYCILLNYYRKKCYVAVLLGHFIIRVPEPCDDGHLLTGV